MQHVPGFVPTAAMRVQEVTLAGNFVILEPLRVAHVDELFPDAMEPELFRYIAPGTEQTKNGLRDWIVARLEEQHAGTALPFLQRDAVTRKAFGATCMMSISTQHHRLEVGHTWLAKSHRKTPANTESKLLILTHAFEEMKAVRVQFKVDVRNTPAQQALERLGAVKEGTMRNERILGDGFVRDAYVYSIIDREWPEVKKRLTYLLWNRPDEPQATPTKPAPPPIPGLEATLRPAAAAYRGVAPAYRSSPPAAASPSHASAQGAHPSPAPASGAYAVPVQRPAQPLAHAPSAAHGSPPHAPLAAARPDAQRGASHDAHRDSRSDAKHDGKHEAKHDGKHDGKGDPKPDPKRDGSAGPRDAKPAPAPFKRPPPVRRP